MGGSEQLLHPTAQVGVVWWVTGTSPKRLGFPKHYQFPPALTNNFFFFFLCWQQYATQWQVLILEKFSHIYCTILYSYSKTKQNRTFSHTAALPVTQVCSAPPFCFCVCVNSVVNFSLAVCLIKATLGFLQPVFAFSSTASVEEACCKHRR